LEFHLLGEVGVELALMNQISQTTKQLHDVDRDGLKAVPYNGLLTTGAGHSRRFRTTTSDMSGTAFEPCRTIMPCSALCESP
jgi:hypothetical protein